jgi:hypothetical protein
MLLFATQISKAHLNDDGQWLLEGHIRQPQHTAAAAKVQPPYSPWNCGMYDGLVLADKMVGTKGECGCISCTLCYLPVPSALTRSLPYPEALYYPSGSVRLCNSQYP